MNVLLGATNKLQAALRCEGLLSCQGKKEVQDMHEAGHIRG